MFADTTFTMKSGPMGTSMFSRVGKYTNYQYLCFNPNQGGGALTPEDEAAAEEQRVRGQVIQEQKEAELEANAVDAKYMAAGNTVKTSGFGATKGPSEMAKTKKSDGEHATH